MISCCLFVIVSLMKSKFLFLYSGKTYTMVGTKSDPGLMVLSLHTIFDLIKKDKNSDEFEVSCSYLEVYNEVSMPFHCDFLVLPNVFDMKLTLIFPDLGYL